MKIEKDPDRPKVGKRRLAQFERDTGLSLPDDYRAFLLKHNGGTPVDARFEIPALREDALVGVFYGVDYPDADLAEELEQWGDEMPPGFLLIGHDPGGAFLVMGTAGEHAGGVYFWDHQHRALRSTAAENTYPLAGSFAAFTASLKPNDGPSRWDADATRVDDLIRTALDHADRLQPIQMARLATEFAKLPDPAAVVPLVLASLLAHPSADVRRVGLGACRRMGAFAAPGLKGAAIEKLADPDGWVRYDAVWLIRDAGYDGPDVREALGRAGRGVTLPKDAARAEKEPSNADLRARVDARQLLDALLAKP